MQELIEFYNSRLLPKLCAHLADTRNTLDVVLESGGRIRVISLESQTKSGCLVGDAFGADPVEIHVDSIRSIACIANDPLMWPHMDDAQFLAFVQDAFPQGLPDEDPHALRSATKH